MATARDEDDDGRERGPLPSEDKGETEGGESRRQFMKLFLAVGLVLVIGGTASVVRSVVSPSSLAPAPPPPTTKTTTQTITSTKTETVTEGSTGSSGSTSTSSTSSGTSSSTSSTSTMSSPFAQVLAANVGALTGDNLGKTVSFNYPLENQPNIMIKLGVKAKGGVGPDGDIVAFSQICQHLGCIWGFVATGASPVCDDTFKAKGPVGYCCCHGSEFDLANAGDVIGGPSPRPVPQVTLTYDESTGDIYAVGMGPPTVFGFHTGSSDVLYDLEGGTPVS